MFVLEDGYERFVERYAQFCTGPSLRRDEVLFADETRRVVASLRDAWRVCERTATGLRASPDARGARGDGIDSVGDRATAGEEWWGDEAETREL
jgi:hypothetical protein